MTVYLAFSDCSTLMDLAQYTLKEEIKGTGFSRTLTDLCPLPVRSSSFCTDTQSYVTSCGTTDGISGAQDRVGAMTN